MARQKSVTHKQSRSKRDTQQKADPGKNQNGHEEGLATYEQELAGLLQERIKPGLNRGAIPLLARSIAKDIARRDLPTRASEDSEADEEFSDEPEDELDDESTGEAEDDFDDEADDESTGQAEDDFDDETDDESTGEAEDEAELDDEADDEANAEADDEHSDDIEPSPDFEADMQELQAELGEDWILRFSVQGDNAWLTAEKEDGSQRLEAPDASVLAEAVDLLNESGGRSN